MKVLLPVCAALTTAKASSLVMQGLVVRDANQRWVAAPPNGLRVFTPTSSYLAGSAFPFGLPPSVEGKTLPFAADDQSKVDSWQRSEHAQLEKELGLTVSGYITHFDAGSASLVVQELPDVVGTKIWAGEWMLWETVSGELLKKDSPVKIVLELGAGCGLCGLLLAANGLDVIVTDTSTGYAGADKTWNNMVSNVEANADAIEAHGGRIQALDLDWTASEGVPRVDLAVGADIIYEPHLFRALMDTIKRSAHRAVIVQNIARAGTEQFRALCQSECSAFTATKVEQNKMRGSFPSSDGVLGRYEVWDLSFDDGECSP